MQVCNNPKCKAKHYETAFTCSNCNWELPAAKQRKAHSVYTLKVDATVSTKRVTEKFLNDNSDHGVVELCKDGEQITYIQRYDGSWFKTK